MNDSAVSESQQKIEGAWWSRERALTLVLAVLTALAFYLCYLLTRPFLPALAWGLALAVVAHPVHEWLARKIARLNLAAALAVAIVAIAIIAPSAFITRQLVVEAAASIETVRDEAAMGRWREGLERYPRLAPALRWLDEQVNVRGALESLWRTITTRASTFVSGSIWALVELLITLFALFYFFRDRRAALSVVRSLVPLSDAETNEVFARVRDTIYATIYGTLVVAAVQGILGGLIFWWLGLPAPLLWGTVMGLLAIVPVLGAFIIWIPAAVYLALQGNWSKALILTAWGGIVIALIDNLLYPILVGNRLRLHTLPVFIAIVGGLAFFGASGLVLGPVALAVTVALVDIWRRRTAGGRTAEQGIKG